MHCRGCRYPLTGATRGVCPECGRRFDPNNPRSYAAARPRLTVRQRRSLAIAACAAAALIVLYIVLPTPYVEYEELDLNSGRERMVGFVFGIEAFARELPPSRFAAFVEEHVGALGPPEWRPAHYSSPFDRARHNYRSGRLRQFLDDLVAAFQAAQAPPEERIRLARAALELTASGARDGHAILTPTGGIQLVKDYKTIVAEWAPAPARPAVDERPEGTR